MPIYEYKCLKCGYQFEHLQKINSDDLVVCPKCQAPKLQRLISHTSFRLKGSGWYATDYQDKNKDKDKKVTDEKTVKVPVDKDKRTKDNVKEAVKKSANKESADTKK